MLSSTGSCFRNTNKIFDLSNEDPVARNYFTAPYSSSLHKVFEKYFNHDDIEATFLPKDRIALTDEILTRTSYSDYDSDPFERFGNFEADSKKGIQRLLTNGTFEDAYPLHDVYE